METKRRIDQKKHNVRGENEKERSKKICSRTLRKPRDRKPLNGRLKEILFVCSRRRLQEERGKQGKGMKNFFGSGKI